MLKRLIVAGVAVVGLVVVALGIASATIWRADDVLVASHSSDTRTLVTVPGVLELGGDPVTVRAQSADGGPVVLAIGRDTDVAAWVGQDAHGTVNGLSNWHTLAVDDVPAGDGPAAPGSTPSDESTASDGTPSEGPIAGDESVTEGAQAGTTDPAGTDTAPPSDPAGTDTAPPSAPAGTDTAGSDTPPPSDPATVADPTGSDMWVAQARGDGSAELVWPREPGRWSLLAVGLGDEDLTLSLAWPRVVTTPWLWPSVVIGGLLALGAGGLLVRDVLRRREPTWHPVTTGAVPVVPPAAPADLASPQPPPTRRQLREAEQASRGPRTGTLARVIARTAPTPAVDPPAEPSGAAAPEPHGGTASEGAAVAPEPDGGTAPEGAAVAPEPDARTAPDQHRGTAWKGAVDVGTQGGAADVGTQAMAADVGAQEGEDDAPRPSGSAPARVETGQPDDLANDDKDDEDDDGYEDEEPLQPVWAPTATGPIPVVAEQPPARAARGRLGRLRSPFGSAKKAGKRAGAAPSPSLDEGDEVVRPTAPGPVSSTPATPAPATSMPATPAPATPAPATSAPATSAPATPTPGTSTPVSPTVGASGDEPPRAEAAAEPPASRGDVGGSHDDAASGPVSRADAWRRTWGLSATEGGRGPSGGSAARTTAGEQPADEPSDQGVGTDGPGEDTPADGSGGSAGPTADPASGRPARDRTEGDA